MKARASFTVGGWDSRRRPRELAEIGPGKSSRDPLPFAGPGFACWLAGWLAGLVQDAPLDRVLLTQNCGFLPLTVLDVSTDRDVWFKGAGR